MPPLPSISGSAVYMRISKQRESAATFLENSIARSPAGPQGGGGSSWAKAKPLNTTLITAASIAVFIFSPLPEWSPVSVLLARNRNTYRTPARVVIAARFYSGSVSAVFLASHS